MGSEQAEVKSKQMFRRKPVELEAYQWWQNGDHPDDGPRDTEGNVVRYFRRPDVPADQLCRHCHEHMHVHGWIDTLEGGHIVCRGDWIITGVKGERYPCKPEQFAMIYEPIPSESPATKRGEGTPCGYCPFCGAKGVNRERRPNGFDTCANGHHYLSSTAKEHACSSGSQCGGNGPVAPSGGTNGSTLGTGSDTATAKPTSTPLNTSNASTVSVTAKPPAWATPQILAECKPGDRLYWGFDCGSRVVRVWPGARMFKDGRERGQTAYDETDCLLAHEPSYTIPTPPPDKPKPDDAEEVARKIIGEYERSTGQTVRFWDELSGIVTAAIRADRQKHAALAGKVRELCGIIVNPYHYPPQGYDLAREVLAMMEVK